MHFLLRIKSKALTMVCVTFTPTTLPDSLCNHSFTGTSPLVWNVLPRSSPARICHHLGLFQMSAPLRASTLTHSLSLCPFMSSKMRIWPQAHRSLLAHSCSSQRPTQPRDLICPLLTQGSAQCPRP